MALSRQKMETKPSGVNTTPLGNRARHTGENISNLVLKEEVPEPKKRLYKSIHDPQNSVKHSTLHPKGGKIYGQRTETNPTEFLRRGGRTGGADEPLRAVGGCRTPHRPKDKLKAPIPTSDDAPIMGIESQKDYITDNAVSAILSTPKSPGNTQDNYLLKKDYGKTPEYLHHLKEELRKEESLIESEIMNKLDGEGNGESNEIELPEEERKELLVALKKKWDIVNSQYQKICHRTNLEHRQREYKKKPRVTIGFYRVWYKKYGISACCYCLVSEQEYKNIMHKWIQFYLFIALFTVGMVKHQLPM